ncbi:hydantoinase/oxoprolinase family protein [Hoeflea prorocentri]|uniref:Hydantoinase/oxoprolinase family protein n=1 Tax=Hoeflea prorocentri TaxID=1922333 RepID=A0A9X3ZI66_9HYPH|nr:hydantoinase/oxoprolinase family protein [Hoeflea prorocentri]MCY6381688.1 hydantoinase/oxoprolinase family protein [Hoeflea prorocentri]MDA5399488.1 hydantoinase/oxoprolinase family protein [Hoeflea prorocentri]
MIRLAVDIGGTFTDIVLETDGAFSTYKLLTTPERPEMASMEGILHLLSREGRELSEVGTIIHGTTLATNALIERKGAKTALVTTEGFRDVLEMRYEKRFDQYDLNLRMPEPLVPRDLRFTLGERVLADGSVLKALDVSDIKKLAGKLIEAGVGAVAVGFLHAYANASHEKLVAEELAKRLPPDVTICTSSDVSAEAREYDRFSTVCANAYVRPLMSSYLQRFNAALRDHGFGGSFMLMLSGGGLTTLEQACRTPIRLVESGPAGGVSLAAHIAAQVNSRRTLAFDLGGTTAKICFLKDCAPQTTRRFEVARAWRDRKGSGLPVRVPTIELVEIGAGGGSIARLDNLKRISVGPESAGASPGPRAYGLGGEDATLTDANVTLGRIAPEGFAGGTIQIDPELARTAIDGQLARPLGLSSPQAAAMGVVEVADEVMANAARIHGLELGLVVADFDLVVSGGGGPLHATRLAEKLSIQRIFVPENAGVGSAVGFLHAPVAFESARSVMRLTSDIDVSALSQSIADVRQSAVEVVSSCAPGGSYQVSAYAEFRYLGQGQEIRLSMDTSAPLGEEIERLEKAFHVEFKRLYGFSMPEVELELVSFSVTASLEASPQETDTTPKTPVGEGVCAGRMIYDRDAEEFVAFRSVPRDALHVGEKFSGPAVVTEAQTTTVIGKGWTGTKLESGHLLVERDAA